MYGEWLAHQVAKELGLKHDGPRTTRRVLAALARTPGPLVKCLVQMAMCLAGRSPTACDFLLADVVDDWQKRKQAGGVAPARLLEMPSRLREDSQFHSMVGH